MQTVLQYVPYVRGRFFYVFECQHDLMYCETVYRKNHRRQLLIDELTNETTRKRLIKCFVTINIRMGNPPQEILALYANPKHSAEIKNAEIQTTKINIAGSIWLLKSPTNPVNAASHLIDGTVAWCPVPKKKRLDITCLDNSLFAVIISKKKNTESTARNRLGDKPSPNNKLNNFKSGSLVSNFKMIITMAIINVPAEIYTITALKLSPIKKL
ncbi:hypothetical protein KUTeg_018467 [Tegillarca granosa]|uniref:Uncharacterized protein n=1 Tax=Tegillarca granosa TaxID=220873 RepID=A0ABQ9EHY5_TEGGR|nr:hypothetical protein KUTeg_018467 [Tegillarca granosa]